jgi:rubredoxin
MDAGVVECSAGSETALLPHACPGAGTEAPLVYQVGPRGRERLAAGESVPASARCPRCGGRAFASLVDPAARVRRRAEARPDPSALREPVRLADERSRRRIVPPPVARDARPASPCARPAPASAPGGSSFGRPGPASARPAPAQPAREECPACGVVPNDFGLCRCSL